MARLQVFWRSSGAECNRAGRPSARRAFGSSVIPAEREGSPRPGRALHELRDSLLHAPVVGAGHAGLPGQQPHSGFQESVLSEQREEASRNLPSPTISPNSQADLPGRRARPSCTLNIDDNPAPSRRSKSPSRSRLDDGWVKPEIKTASPARRSRLSAPAPAGCCAQQLARAGHDSSVRDAAKSGGPAA